MEKVERLRRIGVERCVRLTCAPWPKAKDGDVPAVRALVAIVERRAKLFGRAPIGPAADRRAERSPLTKSRRKPKSRSSRKTSR